MRKIITIFLFLFISFTLMSIGDNDKALIKAARDNNVNNVSKILKDSTIDKLAKDDINGFGALTFASIFGYTDIAKLLIDNGFDVNSVDNVGWTPLMWASYYGNYEIAKMLVERGADVNYVKKEYCDFPLQIATNYGYVNIVKLLLENSAIINMKNKNKACPSTLFPLANGIDTMKVLINAGDDIDGCDFPTPYYDEVTNCKELHRGYRFRPKLYYYLNNATDLNAIKFLLDSGAKFPYTENEDDRYTICLDNIYDYLVLKGYSNHISKKYRKYHCQDSSKPQKVNSPSEEEKEFENMAHTPQVIMHIHSMYSNMALLNIAVIL